MRIADRFEAVNFAGLDDEDVAGPALEGLAVDCPYSATLAYELDLVVRMTMRTRSRTRLAMEQEHRNASAALLSSDKLMRATNERQILLPHVMHPLLPPCGIG